jgi:peptidoglycan biosynthesis protein MviN/MurJ (putative lipid II flippase)
MLTEREGVARAALFHKLNRVFVRVFGLLTVSIILLAPWLIGALAPGLDAAYVGTAVTLLRIAAVSSLAVGTAALYVAFLFTHRRFGPTVLHQAVVNLFTIAAALGLWRVLGVYGFAIGYAAGAWAQLSIVYFAARVRLRTESAL